MYVPSLTINGATAATQSWVQSQNYLTTNNITLPTTYSAAPGTNCLGNTITFTFNTTSIPNDSWTCVNTFSIPMGVWMVDATIVVSYSSPNSTVYKCAGCISTATDGPDSFDGVVFATANYTINDVYTTSCIIKTTRIFTVLNSAQTTRLFVYANYSSLGLYVYNDSLMLAYNGGATNGGSKLKIVRIA